MVNRLATEPQVEVTLRIRGTWEHASELVERLPIGYELRPNELRPDQFVLPDGTSFECEPYQRLSRNAPMFNLFGQWRLKRFSPEYN